MKETGDSMKIIITGGSGQLGRVFAALADSFAGQMVILGSRDLDVTVPAQVNSILNQIQPDVVSRWGLYRS
jgi:dTDP-4-dehydrorhamnose reductase